MKKNNILRQRVELYKDFTINLLSYISYYYLDNNTLSNDDDIKNHYNWCFNKTCEDFKKEDINFSNNSKLREYFFRYYYHSFYINNETTKKEHLLFFDNIFNLDEQIDKNMIKLLMEVYSIFEKTMEIKKKIPELV